MDEIKLYRKRKTPRTEFIILRVDIALSERRLIKGRSDFRHTFYIKLLSTQHFIYLPGIKVIRKSDAHISGMKLIRKRF